MSIFDLITNQELSAYWIVLSQHEAPYPTEELFPVQKKRGLDLKWIKGRKGLPIVLKTSAYDAKAIPRPRIGMEILKTQMPFHKESLYVDEELRQELNMVLETGNQAYIDSVVKRIFDDEMSLLRGARASRERMRMMALTTGIIAITNNGQMFEYDYEVEHKGNAAKSWSDRENADPIEDIRVAKEVIAEETGAVITRAMCDGKTWRDLRNNESIKKEIFVLTNGIGAINDNRLREYVLDQVGITIMVNDFRYEDENGNTLKFMPENTFVMFPAGNLGNTWFGTTPAESDLMSKAAANVSIVDTGVAIQTITKEDPVNVETVVSMICLPSFEAADQVYIMDTVQA